MSDKDIRACLPATVEEVMLKTDCAMNCGACFETLKELVEESPSTLIGNAEDLKNP